jgi:two-component sensor histidine kinase
MFVWELNGPIEFWKTGAERLYGFAPSQAVGRISHVLLQTKFPIAFNKLITQLQNERYWSGELRHICKDGRDGPEVLLEPNTAQAIAVTLHELATNAAKYGSLSVSNGQIELNWSHQDDGRLNLRWTEMGGPPVRAPTRRGFGGQIIKNDWSAKRGNAL